MEGATNLSHFLDIFRRHKAAFILPFLFVLAVSSAVTFLLPAIYRAKATILVEAQDIPQDFVRTTVTGYIEERLQTITQIVLSRKNLLTIIEQFNLYPDLTEDLTTEELVSRMRDNISIDPIQTDVVNPLSGRMGMATVAFTVAFEGKNPEKVTNVVNTLTSLFLEENLKAREEKARTAYDFLESQRDALRFEIQDLERRIAAFKSDNLLALPELMELNLMTLDRLQKEIDAKEQEIDTLADRKIYLEGQLATLDPGEMVYTADGRRLLDKDNLSEEIRSVRSEYLAKKASRSAKHPDVMRLKSQLDALESEYETRREARDIYKELEEVKNELKAAKARYSDKHPDVVRLETRVEELTTQARTLSERDDMGSAVDEDQPENPAYISLKTQIASTSMDIANARRDLAALREKYEDHLGRIENTPRVEQEYSALKRDYQNAQDKYQETVARLQAAREAKVLEESRMAEKLTLVEPPQVPEKPFKPNRPALLFVGIVLSVLSGLGAGSLSEYMDKSVHDADELSAATGTAVLAVIPYLDTRRDRNRRLRRKVLAVVLVLAFLVSVVAGWHVFREPLDVTWYRALRKFDTMF